MEIRMAIWIYLCALMLATYCQAVPLNECGMIGCAQVYQPVCGSDGRTYGNACELHIANCNDHSLSLQHTGACDGSNDERSIDPCNIGCFAVYDPVCGTDSVTYGNTCELAVASCKNQTVAIAHGGEC